MSAHVEVVMQQDDDDYAPPSMPVLRVSVVAGVAFLEICDYDETHDTTTLKVREQVSVVGVDLANALTLCFENDTSR